MTADLAALIFDVDGTLADTEGLHLASFNLAFEQEGTGWYWDEALYTQLLEVSGGKERLKHYWRMVNPNVTALDGGALDAMINKLHDVKTAFYEGAVQRGVIGLRPGVAELIEQASQEGIRLAIATTTSAVNVAALLTSALGSNWRHHFVAVRDASNAPLKKPHPQVYQRALQDIGLPPEACLAFEDSANGLQAATAAGLATIITPTPYTAAHDFTGALRVRESLEGVGLAHLREWHRETQTVGRRRKTA